jgi:hypothetical protein
MQLDTSAVEKHGESWLDVGTALRIAGAVRDHPVPAAGNAQGRVLLPPSGRSPSPGKRVSVFAHEFRTPLGIIQSSAGIVEDYLDRS